MEFSAKDKNSVFVLLDQRQLDHGEHDARTVVERGARLDRLIGTCFSHSSRALRHPRLIQHDLKSALLDFGLLLVNQYPEALKQAEMAAGAFYGPIGR